MKITTLYEEATESMNVYIDRFLELSKNTDGFNKLEAKDIKEELDKTILLAGKGLPLNITDSSDIVDRFNAIPAIEFDTEESITAGVYQDLREKLEIMVKRLIKEVPSLSELSAEYIANHPHYLPIFQRLANISSKSKLKAKVGSVSDHNISENSSKKLLALINRNEHSYSENDLLQQIEPTLEGIVRDLVGRVLLESIVADALDSEKVEYKREEEYSSLTGVVYDFRADFVIPNEQNPLAFIEVRKSSSRHASLYAKDKMFSAINWKGQHKSMLAILVVDGPWTQATLKVMAKIFDYIIPISKVAEMSKIISNYQSGDKSKLKKLIEFKITDL